MCTPGMVYKRHDETIVMVVCVAQTSYSSKYVCYTTYNGPLSVWDRMGFLIEALGKADSVFTLELYGDFLEGEIDVEGDGRHIVPRYTKIEC